MGKLPEGSKKERRTFSTTSVGRLLAAAVEFNWETAYNNIQAVRPGMQVFKLSAKSGEGMENYQEYLATRLSKLRAPSAV
jgi:hydrogenase nickel incorporation protein HypB